MSDPKELKVFSTDANAVPWVEYPNAKTGLSRYMKILHQDDAPGMRISLNFYPKGFVTTWHTHTCGHGMYVLEGILKTHEGLYGPGSFVWFPEGMEMEHGATAETDVLTIFITNKFFDITFKERDS